jgi:hypothetical protein
MRLGPARALPSWVNPGGSSGGGTGHKGEFEMKGLASAAVLVIAAFVIIGGVNLGSTVNHDQHTSDRVSGVWSEVRIGMVKTDVQSILGPPDSSDHFATSDYEGGVTHMDTWFYGTLGSTSYQVSFTDGVVDSKSSM